MQKIDSTSALNVCTVAILRQHVFVRCQLAQQNIRPVSFQKNQNEKGVRPALFNQVQCRFKAKTYTVHWPNKVSSASWSLDSRVECLSSPPFTHADLGAVCKFILQRHKQVQYHDHIGIRQNLSHVKALLAKAHVQSVFQRWPLMLLQFQSFTLE